MILEIFWGLYILSWLFVGFGHWAGMDALKIAGFTAMFMLGFVFLTNNLQYDYGAVISPNGSNLVVTPQYQVYSNHTLAFILTIIAAVGFIFVLVDRRQFGRNYA